MSCSVIGILDPLLSQFLICWLHFNCSNPTVCGLGCSVTSVKSSMNLHCIGLESSTEHAGKRSGTSGSAVLQSSASKKGRDCSGVVVNQHKL